MEYFMKRRNLTWNAFAGLDYGRYSAWCAARGIVPEDESEFLSHTQPYVHTQEEEQSVEEQVIPQWDKKMLQKRRKGDLQALADEYGIELSGDETKRTIVDLLVSLNN
jgi:hypothetical protein